MTPIVASLALTRRGEPADLIGMVPVLPSAAAAWIAGCVNVDKGQVSGA